MRSSITNGRSAFLALALAAIVGGVSNAQPVVGKNVNMLSFKKGQTWPETDAFLRQQYEPSMAVSSRNSLHLLGGANDARTVDFAGLPNLPVETADSWMSYFLSYDGGLTWKSKLLPGCPYKLPNGASACPGNSPLTAENFQAASDPTLRAGSHGLIYYSGIAFNRGDNAPGAVFVARFVDNNNTESADKDPIKYLSTYIVDRGNSGQFQDKPWLAVAPPKAGDLTATVDGTPTVPCGLVYMAYSTFTGTANNPKSKVSVSVSKDCGATFGNPSKISETNNYNLGTQIEVDPVNPANVYVTWRRFAAGKQTDAIMMSVSNDYGQTWSSQGVVVANINARDVSGSAVTF